MFLGGGWDQIRETVFTCAYTCIGNISKDLLLKNQWAQRAQIYVKFFRHSTSLSKSSSPWVGWGHNKRKFSYIFKGFEFSTAKLYYILVPCVKERQMTCRSWPYRVSPSLLNRKCTNISKTVEIPTLNQIYSWFFFLWVSISIWWYMYVSHDRTWLSRPFSNR
jgi:hypothetical protein